MNYRTKNSIAKWIIVIVYICILQLVLKGTMAQGFIGMLITQVLYNQNPIFKEGD